LAITGYAFSRREFAGYGLGWLGGIFLIILFSTLSPEASFEANLGSGAASAQVNFLSAFLPGMVGLMVGFGVLALMRMTRLNSYRTIHALTLAAMMCLVLAAGYMMLLSPFEVRLAIAVFVMGVGISVLFYSILMQRQGQRTAVAADVIETAEMPMAAAPSDAPIMNRVERIRQRFRENRQISDY
jgi:hypothetical protein